MLLSKNNLIYIYILFSISFGIIGIINYRSCAYFSNTRVARLAGNSANFFAWKNIRGLSYKWDFARGSLVERKKEEKLVERGEGGLDEGRKWREEEK